MSDLINTPLALGGPNSLRMPIYRLVRPQGKQTDTDDLASAKLIDVQHRRIASNSARARCDIRCSCGHRRRETTVTDRGHTSIGRIPRYLIGNVGSCAVGQRAYGLELLGAVGKDRRIVWSNCDRR